MSYLAHVQSCNRHDLSGYEPFIIASTRVGWITAARAAVMRAFPDVFSVDDRGVRLHPALTDVDARSAAFSAVAPKLTATGAFPPCRGKLYGVKNRWSDPILLRMDRGLTSAFGVRAFGVHVNGFIRRHDGLHLWIGTRAMARMVEPGKLDNMVAGGQPAGLSLMDNVIKECGEEAGVDPALAATARPAGVISYCCERDGGLRVDTLFCYDLEVPAGFTPVSQDGELSRFDLMPVTRVLETVRDTNSFKFNVNLVILDFAIRHGLISPDREPDYEALVAGLHGTP